MQSVIGRILAGYPEDAEECLSDAVMRIWKHIDCFGGRGSFGGWAAAIAKYAALDRLRVQGDHGITGYVYTAEWLADDIHTPEEACAYMEAMYKSLAMGTYQPKSYTVCAADGKTAVDTFTVRADSGMIAHVKEIYDENGNLREGRESPWAEPLPCPAQ